MTLSICLFSLMISLCAITIHLLFFLLVIYKHVCCTYECGIRKIVHVTSNYLFYIEIKKITGPNGQMNFCITKRRTFIFIFSKIKQTTELILFFEAKLSTQAAQLLVSIMPAIPFILPYTKHGRILNVLFICTRLPLLQYLR